MQRLSTPKKSRLDRRRLFQIGTAAAGAAIGFGSAFDQKAAAALRMQDEADSLYSVVVPTFADYVATDLVPLGAMTYGPGQVFHDPATMVNGELLSTEQLASVGAAQWGFNQGTILPNGPSWDWTRSTSIFTFSNRIEANIGLNNLREAGIPAGATDQSTDELFAYNSLIDLNGVGGQQLLLFGAADLNVIIDQWIYPTATIDSAQSQNAADGFLRLSDLLASASPNPSLNYTMYEFGNAASHIVDVQRRDGVDILNFQMPPEIAAMQTAALNGVVDLFSQQGTVPGSPYYVYVDEYTFANTDSATAYFNAFPSEAFTELQTGNGVSLFVNDGSEVAFPVGIKSLHVKFAQEAGIFGGHQIVAGFDGHATVGTVFDIATTVGEGEPDPRDAPFAGFLESVNRTASSTEEFAANEFIRAWFNNFGIVMHIAD